MSVDLQTLNESLHQALEQSLSIREDTKALIEATSEDGIIDTYFGILRQVLGQSDSVLEYFTAQSPDGPFRLTHNDGGLVDETLASELPVDFEMQDFLQSEVRPITFDRDEGCEVWIPLVRSSQFLGIARVQVPDRELLTKVLLEQIGFVSVIAALSIQSTRQTAHLKKHNVNLEIQGSRMGALVEAINVGLLAIDDNRLVTQTNRNAAMMLRLRDTKPGQPLAAALLPEQLDFFNGLLREYHDQGFAMDQQMTVALEGGSELSIGVNMAPLLSAAATVQGYVFTLRDMTASQELDRLRKLDSMKSDFVNNVSHELRTPLTSIKAYTEALQDMIEDDTHVNFLNVIAEESDRLLGLIENLLNVSRIESGKMVLHREPLDLMKILARVKQITEVQSEVHQVVLDEVELPDLELDPDKMTEVFLNIVGNAIKYSPEGGEVRLAPVLRDGNVEVAISDQGIGLTEEDCQKVFDQFYRVDSSATATIGGTGLGLAITKSIVNAHGGVIRVTSQLGSGSVFTIVLPCDSKDAKDEIQLMPSSSPFG